MKKIVGIVAAASLVAGLAFADGPVANLAVTDFTGNAQVQWGVDLDSGTTGFKNSEYMKFVINLFDAGTKSTSSDNDVWAELVLKAGNTKDWSHKLFNYDGTVHFNADGQVVSPINDAGRGVSFDIDTAKIHFGDFYVGILNGDTVTGEYKVDSAIRGYDHYKNQGRWLTNVGPDGYTQGIVAGYGNSNFAFDVDFRSKPDNNKNQYTSDYAVAVEAKLKDSNEFAEGLGAGAGFSVSLSNKSYAATTGSAEAVETKDKATNIGYSGNLGYKLKLDDKYWFKPYAALTGSYITSTNTTTNVTTIDSSNNVVFGAMLGWGSAKDENGGVYYFDADHQSRKVCSGVSVVATIPLDGTVTTTSSATTTKKVTSDLVQALIVPSFYTKGDLVEGLTAAVYSEIAILRGEASTDANKTWKVAKDKDDTFALALAGAVAYDIKADDVTVTPQVGFRFVNTAYADNDIGNSREPLKNDAFFTELGAQKKGTGKRANLLDNGYFNLKAGVNVNGLINNTDIFAVYQSANLLNGTDYNVAANKKADGSYKKFYNVKLGTINVGCKISL